MYKCLKMCAKTLDSMIGTLNLLNCKAPRNTIDYRILNRAVIIAYKFTIFHTMLFNTLLESLYYNVCLHCWWGAIPVFLAGGLPSVVWAHTLQYLLRTPTIKILLVLYPNCDGHTRLNIIRVFMGTTPIQYHSDCWNVLPLAIAISRSSWPHWFLQKCTPLFSNLPVRPLTLWLAISITNKTCVIIWLHEMLCFTCNSTSKIFVK